MFKQKCSLWTAKPFSMGQQMLCNQIFHGKLSLFLGINHCERRSSKCTSIVVAEFRCYQYSIESENRSTLTLEIIAFRLAIINFMRLSSIYQWTYEIVHWLRHEPCAWCGCGNNRHYGMTLSVHQSKDGPYLSNQPNRLQTIQYVRTLWFLLSHIDRLCWWPWQSAPNKHQLHGSYRCQSTTVFTQHNWRNIPSLSNFLILVW